MFKEQVGYLWGCQFPLPSEHRYEACELTVLIHTTDETIVPTNHRHSQHEVKCPPFKLSRRKRQGLEQATRKSIGVFYPLAYRAALDKAADMLWQLRPPEMLLQRCNSFTNTQVSRVQRAMQFQHTRLTYPLTLGKHELQDIVFWFTIYKLKSINFSGDKGHIIAT